MLNLCLNPSKFFSNSGVKEDFLSAEKNVSIIPFCPCIPPCLNASKNPVKVPFVSVIAFPNIASSLFFDVIIVLLREYVVEAYHAFVEDAYFIPYGVVFWFYICYN